MAQWVSFQELKEKISMSDPGSFHVSTVKNAWNCFGCQRKGNILDFVVEKEGVNIREAGVLLEEWFKVVTA